MALVMLYKTKVRPEAVDELASIRAKFSRIYKKMGISILGHWNSTNDPTETYYMAEYESEDDYTKKVLQMLENDEYRKLTARLNEIRIDFQVERLNPL